MRTRETIRTLNSLIQTCRDGEELCRTCADAADSTSLRSLLSCRSEEWGRRGDELQALVLLLGGEPATAGTLAPKLQASWLTLKALLLGPSDPPVLETWQSAERRARDRYEEALSGYLPERIRRTVSLHADRVIERHEHISALRGQYAPQSQLI